MTTYLPPYTRVSDDSQISPDHHWFIDCDSHRYLELVEWLRAMTWHGFVRWFPEYFPGEHLTDTKLVIQIVASDDRDATLIKLSL